WLHQPGNHRTSRKREDGTRTRDLRRDRPEHPSPTTHTVPCYADGPGSARGWQPVRNPGPPLCAKTGSSHMPANRFGVSDKWPGVRPSPRLATASVLQLEKRESMTSDTRSGLRLAEVDINGAVQEAAAEVAGDTRAGFLRKVGAGGATIIG